MAPLDPGNPSAFIIGRGVQWRESSSGFFHMAQRRFHYEQAFEHYLRANRIPYVAVDEAKKALLPRDDVIKSIKSFDFVVYGSDGRNLLLDVKGRKLTGASGGGGMQNWVTRDDVVGLERWAQLFGTGFQPCFVFMYWCEVQPPDALFEEIFGFAGRWYALRETNLGDYVREMQVRSPRWDTLSVPARAFARISRPFTFRPRPASLESAGRLGSHGRQPVASARSGCSHAAAAVS